MFLEIQFNKAQVKHTRFHFTSPILTNAETMGLHIFWILSPLPYNFNGYPKGMSTLLGWLSRLIGGFSLVFETVSLFKNQIMLLPN